MIKTDFDRLPLNTKRQYVGAQDKSGTMIFIPVNSVSMKELRAKRAGLQKFLGNQPNPPGWREPAEPEEKMTTMDQVSNWLDKGDDDIST